MFYYFTHPILLALFILSGSSNAISSPSFTSSNQLPEIQSYSVDELLAIGGGGCGIALRRKTENPQQMIFSNGIVQDSMVMKLDNKMVIFKRESAEGQDFFGQKTTQTFVSLDDNNIKVKVSVILGETGYEIISIPQGTLRLEKDTKMIEIAVVGDAGC